MFPTHKIQTFSDGSFTIDTVSPPPAGGLPNPVPVPNGLILDEFYNGKICRVKHDVFMRWTNANLSQTNEMMKTSPPKSDGSGVDPRSKITWPIFKSSSWRNRFIEMMGDWVWGRYTTEGFGWCDTGYPVWSLLDCGGNLRIVKYTWGSYAAVEYQKYENGANVFIDYDTHPHLHIKQVLVGKSKTVNPYWVVDKGEQGGIGDLTFPFVSNVQPYHSLVIDDIHQGLEFYPDLPFSTKLMGVPVTITKYGFRGSNTYGEIEGKWYVLDEMLVIGNESNKSLGGSYLDRRIYVEPSTWMKTCPPPVIGWTRNKNL